MTHLRVVLVVAALGAVGVASSPAGAAPRAAKNRCNDAVMILRSNPGRAYEREEVDPLAPDTARRHRAQVADGVARARAKIAQVPPGEFDAADPELAECVTSLQTWDGYLALLDGKLASAEADGRVYAPFLERVEPARSAFLAVLAIAADPATRALDNLAPADFARTLAALAPVEAACATLPAGYAEPPPGYAGGLPVATLVQRPFAWCRIAKRRAELAAAYLAHKTYAAEGYGAYGIVIPELLDKLEAGKGFMDAWVAAIVLDPAAFRASVARAAEGWYRAAGVPLPEAPTARVDALITRLRAKVDALAPTLRFEPGPRAPAIETAARARLLAIYKGAKVLAYAMDATEFTINRAPSGVPVERFRSGQILARVPGSAHCVQRTFSYVEPYAGGGTFSRGAVSILGATRFVACP